MQKVALKWKSDQKTVYIKKSISTYAVVILSSPFMDSAMCKRSGGAAKKLTVDCSETSAGAP